MYTWCVYVTLSVSLRVTVSEPVGRQSLAQHSPDVYNESLSPPSPVQAARSFNWFRERISIAPSDLRPRTLLLVIWGLLASRIGAVLTIFSRPAWQSQLSIDPWRQTDVSGADSLFVALESQYLLSSAVHGYQNSPVNKHHQTGKALLFCQAETADREQVCSGSDVAGETIFSSWNRKDLSQSLWAASQCWKAPLIIANTTENLSSTS